MKSLALSIIICFIGALSFAQSNQSLLKKHFKSISKRQSSFLDKNQMTAFYSDKEVIQMLQPYLSDSKEIVQKEAARLTGKIGSQHRESESRQRAVFQLLTTAQNASDILLERIAKGLQKFRKEDFNQPAIDLLLVVITAKRPHLDKYIKLAGFLQLTVPLDELRVTYKDDKYLRKSVGMALVRSGNEPKVESLMNSIKGMEINDQFVDRVVPLLVYARQKETTDFLFDIILSEEKACHPNGPDVEGEILCGYRVMEEIAPYVKDFPVEVGVSGDLKTADYRQALQDVRQWIGEYRGDYELLTEVY